MKNQSIYDDYAITGWPCHFYTVEAQTKYNAKVYKFCQTLPNGSSDLTFVQKIRLWLYSRYLDTCDVLLSQKKSKKKTL